MNKKRKSIWDKSGGKCWYCGISLGEKGWHIDHFHPIRRRYWEKGNNMDYPELDTFDNLVPSCAPCNNFKHSLDIEGYRSVCQDQFTNIPKYTTGARQLQRLGLLDFTPKPVIFWYEKQGKIMKSKYEIIAISPEAQRVVWVKDPQEDLYYSADFGSFLCTLKGYGDRWVAIAIDYNWCELGRESFPNTSDVKAYASQWALNLKGEHNAS